MFIAHVLLLSCYKKLQKFIIPQLWPPNSLYLNLVDNSMRELQEKVYKTRITDLELSMTSLTYSCGRSDDMIQLGLAHSLLSHCFGSLLQISDAYSVQLL